MVSYSYGRRQPYTPGQVTPFKISRSKIDLYVQCPRCFWLDARLGIKRPSIPAFTLNSAVDHLLKLEFDAVRATGGQHPLQKQLGIDAKPIKHDKLNVWRENFKGVEALHKPTNLLVTGAIDDLWLNGVDEYIVVDYKATSKAKKIDALDDTRWHDQYRRQMEVYQWLLRQNGLKVCDTAYFVYCNGIKDKKAFDAKLEFEITIFPYEGKDDWVEQKLNDIKSCLEAEQMPKEDQTCEHCTYAKSRTVLTIQALQAKK
jgi:CRISPR/Cas system-associated exonuclease Cas4 (RecB family)